jgi:hypothetical protein
MTAKLTWYGFDIMLRRENRKEFGVSNHSENFLLKGSVIKGEN